MLSFLASVTAMLRIIYKIVLIILLASFTSFSAASYAPSCSSGLKGFELPTQHNIKVYHDVTSSVKCCGLCANNAKCVAFTVNKTDCALKDSTTGLTPKKGTDSGIVNG
jgi:hypothetical protein